MKLRTFIFNNKLKMTITMLFSFIVSYIGGYTRTYNAFGGEDLFPIVTCLIWLFIYLHELEE